jgi:hypothetical protein
MRPTIIRQIGKYIFNNELKQSCKNCKYFKKSDSTIIQSTCKKFLVSPVKNIYFENADLKSIDYSEKNPYAIMARLDITMCGLHGAYFKHK